MKLSYIAGNFTVTNFKLELQKKNEKKDKYKCHPFYRHQNH